MTSGSRALVFVSTLYLGAGAGCAGEVNPNAGAEPREGALLFGSAARTEVATTGTLDPPGGAGGAPLAAPPAGDVPLGPIAGAGGAPGATEPPGDVPLDSASVETFGPSCAGFPIPPLEQWDPDYALLEAILAQSLPYDPAICAPGNPMFLAAKARKCPDDLPQEDKWLYEACLALSTAKALANAAKLMPPPIDKFAKAAGKGGQAACCDAAFDTKVPPTWECAVKEFSKAKPTYKSCKSCCDTKWPVLGDKNVVQNDACTKSCTRSQATNAWPET